MPFCHQDPAFVSKRRSDSGDYDFTRNTPNIVKTDIIDSIAKNEKTKLLYNLMGGSLQRGKKQHRRVRSISDIDVNHIKPL